MHVREAKIAALVTVGQPLVRNAQLVENSCLQVMYMNELYPVKVASTGAVFDPDDARMKA